MVRERGARPAHLERRLAGVLADDGERADSAPGVFTKNYGPGQAWALNDDNTFNTASNPVGRGGWIVFWATGSSLPRGKTEKPLRFRRT